MVGLQRWLEKRGVLLVEIVYRDGLRERGLLWLDNLQRWLEERGSSAMFG